MSITVRREHRLGEPLFWIDDDKIRQASRMGPVLYFHDKGLVRREHRFGDRLYFFQGSRVRAGDRMAPIIAWFDDDELRREQVAERLFTWDGDTLKRGERTGPPLLQAERKGLPHWAWVTLALQWLESEAD